MNNEFASYAFTVSDILFLKRKFLVIFCLYIFFRYHFCENCFNAFEGDTVNLGEDTMLVEKNSSILKNDFKKKKNDHLDKEP